MKFYFSLVLIIIVFINITFAQYEEAGKYERKAIIYLDQVIQLSGDFTKEKQLS